MYLKNRPDHAPVGSYLTNFFEVIAPYEGTVKVNDVTEIKRKITQSVNDMPKMSQKVSRNQEYEQLSLF
ncbi:hypothetical protein [Metasolibacillus meyeri]|uniref:hypothetical protein n=1 Tax=Metasolibacillus meyeri TaxID=1071052 RepID=UPI000D31C184|nr:hypothetical protein [Metasolibacillus meyeri]